MNEVTVKYSLYKSEKAEKVWKWGIKKYQYIQIKIIS